MITVCRSGKRSLITVCRSGKRSLIAADILLQGGFTDVKGMTGGMIAWGAADEATAQ